MERNEVRERKNEKRVSKGKGMDCGCRYREKEKSAKEELKCLARYEERKFIL